MLAIFNIVCISILIYYVNTDIYIPKKANYLLNRKEPPSVTKVTNANPKDWSFLSNLVFGADHKYKHAYMSGAMVRPDLMLTSADGTEPDIIKQKIKRYGKAAIRIGSGVNHFIEEFYISENLSELEDYRISLRHKRSAKSA